MNAFDILVAVLLGYSLIRGLFRGMWKELASIVGVLGGFWAAYTFYATAAGYLSGLVSSPVYRNILAFMAVFCIVLILVNVTAIILKYLMRIAFLGWLDRLGGVLFGAVKGVLVASVILLALTSFLPKGTPLIRDSATAPHLTIVAEHLTALISSDLTGELASKLDALKKGWNLIQ